MVSQYGRLLTNYNKQQRPWHKRAAGRQRSLNFLCILGQQRCVVSVGRWGGGAVRLSLVNSLPLSFSFLSFFFFSLPFLSSPWEILLALRAIPGIFCEARGELARIKMTLTQRLNKQHTLARPCGSFRTENDRYRAQRGSISQAAQRPDSVGRKKEREKREREGGNQLRHYAHSYAGDYAVEYAATTSHTVMLVVQYTVLSLS